MAHGVEPQAVGQPEHGGVGGQHVTDHARHTRFGGTAHQPLHQAARQSLMAPVIGDDDGELALLPGCVDHVARLGNGPRDAADERFDDQRLVLLVVDLGQPLQPVGR